MFGLLRPLKRLVGEEDWRDYASAYCNLCASLSQRYGLTSRLLVVHDVATADWLLAGAAAVRRPFPVCNCVKGGTRSVPAALRTDERQSLLAAVSAYTVGVKVQDDLADGGSWKARLAHALYRETFARARRDLAQGGFDVAAFEAALAEQRELERHGETDLAVASGPSGRAFGRVARHLAERHGGVRPDDADALGERIGRAVFLVDAYQDFGRDLAAGAYNPLRCAGGSGAVPLDPGRAREALGVVDGLLEEAQAICARMSERVAVRWRAARASLAHRVGHGAEPPETGITQQVGFTEDPAVPGETPEEEEARRRRRRGRKRKEGRPCGVSGCCEDDRLAALICCDVGSEGACCCLELMSCW
jgi:Family of unknown function (DUF5685)